MNDLKYALRTLAQSPGFTALSVLVLGLGIGANVAIFSAVDAVLFRPLPVSDPSSLFRVFAVDESGFELFNNSYPVFTDYRDQATSFSGLAAFSSEPVHLARASEKAERVTGGIVSGNYFDVLGATPELGRLLSATDDRAAGAHPVAVASDRLWRRSLGADPRAVGSPIRINGHPFTLVGVAPPRFTGVDLEETPDLWVPMAMADQALPELASHHPLTSRNLRWLDIVGRLKPGVTARSAQAELDAIAKRRAASQPKDRHDPMARLVPAGESSLSAETRGTARRISWLLLASVTAILLIACANAAGLLLVRAHRRRREMGIRMALGATGGRLARLLLVESLLLAGFGVVAGVFVAVWAADTITGAAPDGFAIPLALASRVLDGRVLLFAASAGLATGLCFGLAPALSASRRDVVSALKGGAAPIGRRLGLRDVFAASQLALTAALLVGTGLLVRTLAAAAAVHPGFDPSGRVVASMDLAQQGYAAQPGAVFYGRLLSRLREDPRLAGAALAQQVPVQRSGMRVTVDIDGQRTPSGEHPAVDLNVTTPGFFATLGAPVRVGRDFSEGDSATAPAVAIVNEAMARRFWPGQNPIGKRIQDLGPRKTGTEVVGLAPDMRSRNLREPAAPTVYLPLTQFYVPRMTAVARGNGSVAAASHALEEAAAALDGSLPLFHARSLDEQLGRTLGQERLLAKFSGGFAALALLIAAAGLYGVVSSAAQARTREFGIRVALGAQPNDVRRLVLGHGARLTIVGLAAGLGAAALSGRVLADLLFGVAPLDPLSFAAAAVVLAAAAWAAGAAPARRAVRANPVESLQSE